MRTRWLTFAICSKRILFSERRHTNRRGNQTPYIRYTYEGFIGTPEGFFIRVQNDCLLVWRVSYSVYIYIYTNVCAVYSVRCHRSPALFHRSFIIRRVYIYIYMYLGVVLSRGILSTFCYQSFVLTATRERRKTVFIYLRNRRRGNRKKTVGT